MARLSRAALAFTLLLGVVNSLAGSPRIVRTLLLDAPPGFSMELPGALERLEGFPATTVTSIDSPAPRLGQVTWYKLELEQLPPAADATRSLRLLGAAHDRIVAYLVDPGRPTRRSETGFKVPAERRGPHPINLVLPLEDWRTERAAVYISILTKQQVSISPAFLTEAELLAETGAITSLTFTYIGGVVILLLVQSALFLNFRDRATRDYALFSVGLLTISLAQSGLLDRYLGGALGGFYLGDWRYHIRLLNCILGMRALGSYFDLQTTAPALQRFLDWSIRALAVVIAAAFFLDLSHLRVAVSVAPLASMVILTVTCAITIRHRLVGARLISIGWMAVVGATVYLNLIQLSALPSSSVTSWIAVTATLWELFFSTVALTHKFERLAEIRHQKELRELELAGMDRMVRVLCHDLNSPLATISMTTDLMQLNREAGRTVDLDAATSRLQLAVKSIKEIVDSARNVELLKLQGGDLAVEPVNLCAAFDEAESLVQDKLRRKRITIRKTDWPEFAVVMAEPRMLRLSVIANALSNALKFSPAGGVIEVGIRREGSTMTLSIRDRGAGIPRELREAFSRFGRMRSRPGTMNEEGTGFGVMLMRDFTKAMNGEFRLESRTADEAPADHGTTVEIRLGIPVAVTSLGR